MLDKQQIHDELGRPIALRTDFFQKGNRRSREIPEFEQAGRRIRELLAQLAHVKAA
jgi:hypothetical protein